jgi:hypothetical protein
MVASCFDYILLNMMSGPQDKRGCGVEYVTGKAAPKKMEPESSIKGKGINPLQGRCY